jgi:ABC-2 type transport system ATP-binding protein
MALLAATDISKRFDGVTAVDQVSFVVDRGQVVGFLGPNGAGKSTTLRLITQYYEPDSGAITLDGIPLAEAAREAKRRIGYLPENNPLYGDMLVSEYLAFIADLRELAGPGRRQALDAAVTATGIEAVYYRPIGELSKGFRQRVGLAQAILHRPDLLVLDEPTEGLDPNQRIEIRRLIGELGKDRTVILSTHVLSEVQHTCSASRPPDPTPTAASRSASRRRAPATCGRTSSGSPNPAAGCCTSCIRPRAASRICSTS